MTMTLPSPPSARRKDPSAATHKKNRRVSFSKIRIIEFPYAIGDTPCSFGVPIGASHIAQYQTSFQLDHFESSRPERRSKTDLHLSAMKRKVILLRSGYSAEDISAATKAATAIRKERAETLRELRAMVQSMTLESLPAGARSLSSSSPGASACPSRAVCPSPVATSPLRPSHRRRSTSRAEDILRQRHCRRRLSQTTSPMPLKAQTQRSVAMKGYARQQSLSPLRTKTKLSSKRVDTSLSDFGASPVNPTNCPLQSPLRSPATAGSDSKTLFCTSPTLGRNHKERTDNNKRREKENQDRQNVVSPMRPRLTPVKRGRSTSLGRDRPMVMPKRCQTPPKSPICAARMY